MVNNTLTLTMPYLNCINKSCIHRLMVVIDVKDIKHYKKMDSDRDVGGSVKQTESCSNGFKRQILNSSDTSDADGYQRETRRPKLR